MNALEGIEVKMRALRSILSAAQIGIRTLLGQMAAEVKHRQLLKCFEQGNAMACLRGESGLRTTGA